MSEFYVYVVFRPWGLPCYVGKGCGDRYLSHLSSSHNKYLSRIAKKAGGDVPIVKVRVGLSEQEAFEVEVALIAALGRLDLGTGPLVNLTSGGDGVVGHRRTGAQRQEMSVARKGRRVSEATKEKISAKMRGVDFTPEHCAAVSSAKKGVKLGPMPLAQRQAIGKAHMGKKRSDKAREAMHQANLAFTPEQRAQKSERISAALTGKRLTDEHRRSISLAQAQMDPGVKAAKAEKVRQARLGTKARPETTEARKKKLDAEEVSNGYLQGASVNELAARFGVSGTVIDRYLRETNTPTRSRLEALRLRNSRAA